MDAQKEELPSRSLESVWEMKQKEVKQIESKTWSGQRPRGESAELSNNLAAITNGCHIMNGDARFCVMSCIDSLMDVMSGRELLVVAKYHL